MLKDFEKRVTSQTDVVIDSEEKNAIPAPAQTPSVEPEGDRSHLHALLYLLLAVFHHDPVMSQILHLAFAVLIIQEMNGKQEKK